MHWYAINFDADDVKRGCSIEFLRDFADCVQHDSFQQGLALFRERGLVAGSRYYLPPSANKLCAELIKKYRGTIIPKPSREQLEVTVGPKGSLDYWYRKTDSASSRHSTIFGAS